VEREKKENEYLEKLVKLNRVAKVVKGGRRFSFSALSVVGDRKGSAGFGFGKANDVSEAIRKSLERARKSMKKFSVKALTLPHPIKIKFKGARVLLRPAAPGTGIIAGGPIRAVMEAIGVRDILSKSLGSPNAANIVKATFIGLENMMEAKRISENRGKTIKEMWG
jgi:small subunit ribosomal protein S5